MAVKGPIRGEAVKLKDQIILNLSLETKEIPIKFLVIPNLSRPCLTAIEVLDDIKSCIEFEKGKINFLGSRGKPTLRISSENQHKTERQQQEEQTKRSTVSENDKQERKREESTVQREREKILKEQEKKRGDY